MAEPDDDNSKNYNNNNNNSSSERTNVTDVENDEDNEDQALNESTTEPVDTSVAVDLVQQENESLTNETHDEKSTAKRTVNNQRFNAPIVVKDEGGDNLFTPADEYSRKQINVQIIEPESHNNGQFLKETLFQRQENSTSITSTTTTTERSINGLRRSGAPQKIISNKFLAPIQAGLRLSNDERKGKDDDCEDDGNAASVAQRKEEKSYIEVQKNTKIKKITVENPPHKKGSIFGSRFATTTKSPCDQAKPCSALRPPTVTPLYYQQPQNIVLPTQRPVSVSSVHSVHSVATSRPVSVSSAHSVQAVAMPPPVSVSSLHHVQSVQSVQTAAAVVETPRTHVVQQPVYVHTHTEVPVEKTRVVQQPVYVHTRTEVPVEKIVDRPVPYPVEKVVKQLVKVPYPVEVEKLVVKEVPVDRVVEKHVNHAVTVDRPYPVEKVVEKFVHVPYEVEKIVDRPVEIEKIVEKAVPVDRIVDRYIDRPIPVEVGVPVFVEVPVHSPYPVHVPVPYLVKPPPPPQPKHFLITKTTKYTKGHLGLFDFKRNHKHVKHVIIKPPPNIVSDEIISHPSDIDSIGLSPPPR